jgi:hypothetical protein
MGPFMANNEPGAAAEDRGVPETEVDLEAAGTPGYDTAKCANRKVEGSPINHWEFPADQLGCLMVHRSGRAICGTLADCVVRLTAASHRRCRALPRVLPDTITKVTIGAKRLMHERWAFGRPPERVGIPRIADDCPQQLTRHGNVPLIGSAKSFTVRFPARIKHDRAARRVRVH